MSIEPIHFEDVDPEVFQAKVGTTFKVAEEEGGDYLYTAELVEVEIYNGKRPSGTKPFSLYFVNKDGMPVRQQIFWLDHADLGQMMLFLVPNRAQSEVTTFQAVVN
jgi:uncharacterized protein DUF6916